MARVRATSPRHLARLVLRKGRTGWRLLKGEVRRRRHAARNRRQREAFWFLCNVCGTECVAAPTEISRDTVSCPCCRSSVRTRAVMAVFSRAVHGRLIPGPDLPVRKSLRGIGFSDQRNYAKQLRRATRYRNTWYHKAPFRDIMDAGTFEGKTYHYAICSDVLEHVGRPAEVALRTLATILRPGGLLILSVPQKAGETIEHYPELTEYVVEQSSDGAWWLRGRAVDGSLFEATDLIFHGGPGSTVEMRIWGRDTVRRELEAAGFEEIEEFIGDIPEFGIVTSPDPAVDIPGRGNIGLWVARKRAAAS